MWQMSRGVRSALVIAAACSVGLGGAAVATAFPDAGEVGRRTADQRAGHGINKFRDCHVPVAPGDDTESDTDDSEADGPGGPAWDRPAEPDDVSASRGTRAGSVRLAWSDLMPGSTALRCYVIRWRSIDGESTGRLLGLLPDASPDGRQGVLVTGLEPGVEYKFAVAGVSSLAGPWGWTRRSITVVGAPEQPAAPNVERAGRGRLRATWVRPTNLGGAAFAGGEVARRIDGGPWTAVPDEAGDPFSVTLARLQPGAAYEFRVRVSNAAGFTSAWSQASDPIVARDVPEAPGRPAVANTAGDLEVTWRVPEGNGARVEAYEVRVTNSATRRSITRTSPRETLVVAGLERGVNYTAAVRARNSVGWGEWSGESANIRLAAPPLPPRDVNVQAANGRLDLRWRAPQPSGPSVTGYRIERRQGSAWVRVADVKGTAYTALGLVNGVEVRYRVIALAGPIESSPVDVAGTPLGRPGAPTAVSLGVVDSQLTLTWRAPNSNGGSPITAYRIDQRVGAAWKQVGETRSTSFAAGKPGANGYAFRVSAVSKAGVGPAVVSKTLLVRAPGVPRVDATATNSGGAMSVTVTWSAASAGSTPVASYTVTATPRKGGAAVVRTVRASVRSMTLTGLRADTWVVAVTATDEWGVRSAPGTDTVAPRR